MNPFLDAFAESIQAVAGRKPRERTRYRRGHGMSVAAGSIVVADFIAPLIGTTLDLGEIVDVEIPAGMTWTGNTFFGVAPPNWSREAQAVTLKFSAPPKLTIRKLVTFTGLLDSIDISLSEVVAHVRIDGPVGWVVNQARMAWDWSGP